MKMKNKKLDKIVAYAPYWIFYETYDIYTLGDIYYQYDTTTPRGTEPCEIVELREEPPLMPNSDSSFKITIKKHKSGHLQTFYMNEFLEYFTK